MDPKCPQYYSLPPLKLNIVLNVAVVLHELFLDILQIGFKLPYGLMCGVAFSKDEVFLDLLPPTLPHSMVGNLLDKVLLMVVQHLNCFMGIGTVVLILWRLV